MLLNSVLGDDPETFLGVIIAEAFLAQEIGRKPSPASGIESDADDGHGIMWLVEKRRPTTVYRYSGTLSHHSQGKDQWSSTIYMPLVTSFMGTVIRH
jgi:hypothetical protein